MMPNLPQLPAMAGAKTPGGAEESSLPLANPGKGESFASLISQAVTSNHSSAKDQNASSQTPAKDQAKPETSSGLPVLDAAMMLGAGFAIPVIPPTSATPLAKTPTGNAQLGTNANVMTGQAIASEKTEEAGTHTVTAGAGKINSANSVAPQVSDSEADQVTDGKSLVAALGLQSIRASASTEAVAKAATANGSKSLEVAQPDASAGDLPEGAGAVAGLKKTPGLDDAGVSSAAKVGLSSAGTPIAKSIAAMKKPEQTNSIAGVTGKFLPGGSLFGSTSPGLKIDAFTQSGNISASAVSAMDSGADAGRSAVAEAVSAAADPGARTVERTHELVVQNAMRLSNSAADSLQVVIKPDAGTQLSLELRQRGDGVEVQAVLHQGDFNQLSQNWNHLQQQLQQRGIQLGDLTHGDNFNGNGNGHLQQGGNEEAGNTVTQTPVITTVAASSTGAGSAVTNVPALAGSGGWQTWA